MQCCQSNKQIVADLHFVVSGDYSRERMFVTGTGVKRICGQDNNDVW